MLPATAVLSGTGSPVARLVDKLRLCALSLARKLGNFLEMPKFPISKFSPFSAVSVQSFAKKYAAAACVPGQDVDAKLVPRQGTSRPLVALPGSGTLPGSTYWFDAPGDRRTGGVEPGSNTSEPTVRLFLCRVPSRD